MISKSILIRVAVVLVYCKVVYGIVCTPNFCDDVSCTNAETADDCKKKGGNIEPNSTECKCCPACIIRLGLGAECSTIASKIRGGPPPTVFCDDKQNLECSANGTCTYTSQALPYY